MNDQDGYAVFFFPQALEVLGEAIKPYLQPGPPEPHVLCQQVDTGGALIQMTVQGRTPGGMEVELELMVPTSMVRMIVSAHSDDSIGFTSPIRATAGKPAPMPVAPPQQPEPSQSD